MFTIGGFGRIAGVSAKTLRAWDEARLFAPAWVDPSSGYRYYSAAQLPGIRRILGLRQVGMSLAEIGDLVGGGADLGQALTARRLALEAEQRDVARRLAALDIRVATGDNGSGESDVVVRQVAAERVATFDLGLQPDGDIGAAFYELEAHVRDAGARAPRPPGGIYAGGATAASDRDPDGLAGDVIFVPINRAMTATDRIDVRRLPACRAATILHRGRYETLGAARQDLERWVAVAGFTPAGPLRILYLQFGAERELRLPRGWVVDRDDDFMTELQLPVS